MLLEEGKYYRVTRPHRYSRGHLESVASSLPCRDTIPKLKLGQIVKLSEFAWRPGPNGRGLYALFAVAFDGRPYKLRVRVSNKRKGPNAFQEASHLEILAACGDLP